MRTPLLTLALTCASLLAPLSLDTHAQSATAAATTGQARVIVKYKADSSLMRMQALSAATQHTERAQALGQRMGLALRGGSGVAERTQVVFAGGMTSEQLAQRLAAESDVEYAVPDQRRRRMVAPNDSYYTTRAVNGSAGGPVSGQWYLRANAGDVKSSIDVEPAWNLTTGSTSIVVAVLDTGVRFDHPDLKTVALGGNLLPGYDMIASHDGTFGVANDGNGRDADPSDPGDWISTAENAAGEFKDCGVSDSSWHGTQTGGLIGALTNNGEGMASVGRTVRVLPVRVLGKCGGFDSDIIAGMRWAAGLATGDSTVPTNPNRAQVINMSLGGSGACSAAYQDAVTAIIAAGTTIVASAGNSSGHAVSSPANCTGVIAVAGLRHVGTKVGFSDLGSQISISAPGGNCVNATGACLYPILTTTNTGTTTPVAGTAGATYSDAFNISVGTSFSAPLVAGTAALMLSANPSLTPTQVRDLMRSSARAFPTTGGTANTPQCVAPQPVGQTQIDQAECYCTTATCGAGMLDAGAAVTQAAASVTTVQARISVSPTEPKPAQAITLSANPSTVPVGRTIASYLWAVTNGGGIVSGFTGAANGATASVTPSAAGTFTVSLTVTDNTGAQSTTTSTITVAAPLQAGISVTPATPLPGQAVSLSAASTIVPTGRSIATYLWVLTDGGGIVNNFIGAINGPTALVNASAAGTFSVSVTVTDNTGTQSTATTTVTVAATSGSAPVASAPDSGGGGAMGGGWLLLLAAALGALRHVAGRRRHA